MHGTFAKSKLALWLQTPQLQECYKVADAWINYSTGFSVFSELSFFLNIKWFKYDCILVVTR
jgi:hypothetical protein